MLSQVDPDDSYTNVVLYVLDHRRDGTAVTMSDKYMKTRKGQKKLRQTTTGWSFHVKWKDRLKFWVSLKDLKETNPVDVAEYLMARGISKEPAFAW